MIKQRNLFFEIYMNNHVYGLKNFPICAIINNVCKDEINIKSVKYTHG